MIVTLDIFSGRPNPSWTLSEGEQKQLLDRVTGRAVAPVEAAEFALGYRGLVVQTAADDVEGLPQQFRIAGVTPTGEASRVTGDRALSLDEENEVAQFLLTLGHAEVPDDLQQFVAGALQRRIKPQRPIEPLPIPEPAPIPVPPPCLIQNTPYNPGFWNVPEVQYWNNCYNYAMNYRSDTFAQPGKISGQMYTALDCTNVGAAASRDGCKPTCSGIVKKVALVIWPGMDFHWYRQHSEGFWGHKPGTTKARNTDNQGRVINGTSLTPATCDRGPYSAFCGYRYSPKGMKVK